VFYNNEIVRRRVKMRDRWKITVVIFAILFVFLLPAAGAEPTKPIKIGVIAPLTGPVPAIGEDLKNGVLVWKALHPDGILGRSVEFIVRDTGLKPGVAVSKYKEFVEVEHVDFVIGSPSSAVCLALLPFAAKYRIIYFSTGAKADSATGKAFAKSKGYYFRLGSGNTVSASRAGAILAKKVWPDAKSVLHIGPSYAWGYDIWAGQKEWFQKNWPELRLMDPIWHPMGTRNFTPYISKILNMKPDIVTASTWGDDEAVFVRQAVPYGFFDKVHWTPVTFNVPELRTLGNATPEGIWGAPSTYWFQAPDTPEKNKIMETWHSLGYPYPGWCGQEVYATLECLRQACEKIETIDTEAVKEALEGFEFWNPMCGSKVKIRALNHQALNPRFCGQLKYDPTFGHCVYDRATWKWIKPQGLYYTDEELRKGR
jgi:branched-chain amino acid transport system substrate-binding protein